MEIRICNKIFYIPQQNAFDVEEFQSNNPYTRKISRETAVSITFNCIIAQRRKNC